MFRFRDLPLHVRLLAMAGLLVAGFLAVVLNMLYAQTQRAEDARVASLHAIVQTARGIAASLQQDEVAGKITHAAAMDRFRATLHAMRYGNGDYVFAYFTDGVLAVLPPKPELEGKNLKGQSTVQALLDVAANGGGVQRTSFPRPGTTTPVPKLNYIESFQPWNMVIATGVFIDDLQAEAYATWIETGLKAGLVITLAGALAWLMGRSISRPLLRLEATMTAIAAGDLSTALSADDRRDEIGRMTRAVAVFRSNAEEKLRLEATRQHQQDEAQAAQRRTAADVADRLQTQIGAVAGALHTASERLSTTASGMRDAMGSADGQAMSARTVIDATTSNIEMVAAAAEQLASSVREISSQVSKSSTISVRAVEEARRTDSLVQMLAQSATKIGSIVQVISGIAGQTNLLALNATIEAARAGEAGKGFAVVASEVKNLANQTAKATDEIAAQIEQIQAATQDAVSAIGRIGTTIDEISQLSGGIAAAVEEQGAATQEISRNVRQVASGTQQVAESIAGASSAVSSAGGAATDVLGAAEAIAHQSRTLDQQLGLLVDQVRAA